MRGDYNSDGKVDVADGVSVLNVLFAVSDEQLCRDAADSGTLNMTDGLAIFNYLFANGGQPPMPGPSVCGSDPTPDRLDCGVFEACP